MSTTQYMFFDELDYMVEHQHGNRWLRFENMSCYIRVSRRAIGGKFVVCIQLANLGTDTPRQGTFTRLVKALQCYDLPLYLENVLNRAWADALIARHGWRMLVDRGEFPSDLVKDSAQ